MKIRTGFVSNSSSSSFVIVGYRVKFPSSVMEKAKKEMVKNRYSLYSQVHAVNVELSSDKDIDDYDVLEYMGEEFHKRHKQEIVFLSQWETNFSIKNGEDIVGILVSDIHSDGEGEDINLSLPELQKKVEIIKKGFKVVGDPAIYAGMRSC